LRLQERLHTASTLLNAEAAAAAREAEAREAALAAACERYAAERERGGGARGRSGGTGGDARAGDGAAAYSRAAADAQADLLHASLEALRASLLAAAAARRAPLLTVPLLGTHKSRESSDVVVLAALALWGDVHTWRLHAAEPCIRAALRMPAPQDGLLDAEALSRCVFTHACNALQDLPSLADTRRRARPAASAPPCRR
jgi:hypothetical protein